MVGNVRPNASVVMIGAMVVANRGSVSDRCPVNGKRVVHPPAAVAGEKGDGSSQSARVVMILSTLKSFRCPIRLYHRV